MITKIEKYNKLIILTLFVGIILGCTIIVVLLHTMTVTSTDNYCQKCHIHTNADANWKLSTHVNNASGTTTHCIDCHLPSKNGFAHFSEKTKIGISHLWSYYTKDSSKFDWEAKSQLENAVKIVYNESCKACHSNLLPFQLSDNGIIAHLYYIENEKRLFFYDNGWRESFALMTDVWQMPAWDPTSV